MADILSKGSLFPEELIPDFIKKTTGASALAKLCSATPIPFNGVKEFTFSLDKEVDIVAENGAKTKGGLTVDPITIVPIKIEYGARISDEFLYASEDAQLDYMSAFADGFAKKVAKGLDLMAFHGVNPRTGTASSVIGTNHFDSKVTQAVTIASGSSLDRALVGDFVNCFKWGYAKEIPIEVIRYGNPDNDTQLGDLKGHNQVYLRGEAYIGWGILDPSAFAHIKAGE